MRIAGVHIMRAAAVAAAAHAGQTRQHSKTPYINHPIRVAAKAAEIGLATEVIVAALLHDVVEDTDTTMEEFGYYDFPPRALVLVALLTKPDPKKPAPPEYYERIRGDPEAAVLKVLDRLDNLMDMHALLIQPETYLHGRLPNICKWAQRYAEKSETYVTPLLETPLVTPFVAELYRSVLGSVVERARLGRQLRDFGA